MFEEIINYIKEKLDNIGIQSIESGGSSIVTLLFNNEVISDKTTPMAIIFPDISDIQMKEKIYKSESDSGYIIGTIKDYIYVKIYDNNYFQVANYRDNFIKQFGTGIFKTSNDIIVKTDIDKSSYFSEVDHKLKCVLIRLSFEYLLTNIQEITNKVNLVDIGLDQVYYHYDNN